VFQKGFFLLNFLLFIVVYVILCIKGCINTDDTSDLMTGMASSL